MCLSSLRSCSRRCRRCSAFSAESSSLSSTDLLRVNDRVTDPAPAAAAAATAAPPATAALARGPAGLRVLGPLPAGGAGDFEALVGACAGEAAACVRVAGPTDALRCGGRPVGSPDADAAVGVLRLEVDTEAGVRAGVVALGVGLLGARVGACMLAAATAAGASGAGDGDGGGGATVVGTELAAGAGTKADGASGGPSTRRMRDCTDAFNCFNLSSCWRWASSRCSRSSAAFC